MKRIKRIVSLIIASVLLLGCFVMNVSAEETDSIYHGDAVVTTVWDVPAEDDPYTLHRIPGIVVTKEDTVIVYCEARDTRFLEGTAGDGKNTDWCRMDIMIMRSEDGGETFGEPIYIARGGQGLHTNSITVNNPVMIVGEDNTLHMLYCSDYAIGEGGGMWYTQSRDDGKTWTVAKSVMHYAEAGISYDFNVVAFGPTHGITTSDGILMTAMWVVPAANGRAEYSHGPSRVHVFYSMDNGVTWKVTGQLASNTNETTLAELSDGSIMANSRDDSGLRAVTVCSDFDPDGSILWTGTTYPPELIDPGCCGSIATVNIDGLPNMLLAVNCHGTKVVDANGVVQDNGRENITVMCSFDDGVTYEKSYQISGMNEGGYVDIAVDDNGRAYVLWEISAGKKMQLTRFSLADEFCTDDEYIMNDNTDIVFDTDMAVSMAKNYRSMNGKLVDGNLRIVTSDAAGYKNFEIDYSSYTRMIELSKYKYLVCKVRVDETTPADAEFEFYFRSGQKATNDPDRCVATTLKNDGEWRTVVLDMSELDIRGTLQNMLVRVSSTGEDTDVVTADIAGIAFFKTAKEANGYEFTATDMGVTPEDTTPEAQAPETTEAPVDENGGCGSAVSGGIAVVAMSAIGACLFTRKNKKRR